MKRRREQVSENSDVEESENNVSNEEIMKTKNEEDFGLQPDDIDHFYKEPDYEEEEDRNSGISRLVRNRRNLSRMNSNSQPETGF